MAAARLQLVRITKRFLMKYFRTKSIDVVKVCHYFFGAILPSVLVLRKADKLALGMISMSRKRLLHIIIALSTCRVSLLLC